MRRFTPGRRGRPPLLLATALLGIPIFLPAQARGPAGVYRVEPERHLIVRGAPPDRLSILDTRTGHVRNLTPEPGDGRRYTHGPTRSRPEPVSGTVEFRPAGEVAWTSERLGTLVGRPIEGVRREVVVETGDGARLRGELFLPRSPGPHPVMVIVPLGDRQSLWEPAMWLYAAGHGVFVYDQRGSGRSGGRIFESNSHTLESLQLADDAVSVLRRVRGLERVDATRVGILGWSQGGWVGAMAASRAVPPACYVNIAANANPWPEQAEHRFLARLQREGFAGPALDEARRYFTALRAVSDFRIGWEEYAGVRDRYGERRWYRSIVEIFPFFAYGDYREALAGWSVETPPEVFFRRLARVPSLGVYFEWDQSNPPDSPRRFRRALEAAGNPNVDVRTFDGVNHGAWVVDGFDFQSDGIERREPAVFEFVTRWVGEHCR